MFEQVGNAALISLFIFGTHMVPKVYGHKRQLGLMSYNDVKSVGESDFVNSKFIDDGGLDHRVE